MLIDEKFELGASGLFCEVRIRTCAEELEVGGEVFERLGSLVGV